MVKDIEGGREIENAKARYLLMECGLGGVMFSIGGLKGIK